MAPDAPDLFIGPGDLRISIVDLVDQDARLLPPRIRRKYRLSQKYIILSHTADQIARTSAAIIHFSITEKQQAEGLFHGITGRSRIPIWLGTVRAQEPDETKALGSLIAGFASLDRILFQNWSACSATAGIPPLIFPAASSIMRSLQNQLLPNTVSGLELIYYLDLLQQRQALCIPVLY